MAAANMFPENQPFECRSLSLEQAIQLFFGGVDPEDVIAIGATRHGSLKAGAYLHWFSLAPVRMLAKFVESAALLRTLPAYWSFDVRRRTASSNPERIDKAAQTGAALKFNAERKYVSAFSAVVVDLDVNREGGSLPGSDLPQEAAASMVMDRINRGRLPAPTAFAFSPRGLYLIYILQTSESDIRIPLATQAAEKQRKSILAGLKALCADLAFDGSSGTIGRFFRLPGPEAGRAQYLAIEDQHGNTRKWTLDELQSQIKVEPVAPSTVLPRKKRMRASDHPSRRSWRQNVRPSFVRIAEMQRINEARRGIKEGSRHLFLLYYSIAWRQVAFAEYGDSTVAYRIAREEVVKINSLFDPPMTEPEIYAAMHANPSIIARNDTVAAALQVTAAEVLKLSLTSLLPEKIASDRRRDRQHSRQVKAQERDRKNKECDQLLVSGRPISSVASLVGMSKSTVWKRRQALKLDGRL